MSAFDRTLEEVEAEAHKAVDAVTLAPKGDNPISNQARFNAQLWLSILQARAALEAAELQRQAIEAQTEKTRLLVRWTIALAVATIVLAAAAIVALFLVPEIIVEVPQP